MSKKAIIVTVYNSENSGSFLQAFAMKTVLEREGYEVAFFERDVTNTSHDLKSRLKLAAKDILKLKFTDAAFVLKKYKNFDKYISSLKTCTKDSDFYKEAETVVIGSDTVWNFEVKSFRNKGAVYLGSAFEGKRVLTYAASAANVSSEKFHEVYEKHGCFEKLYGILVRDEYTKKLVKDETGFEAELVCDPTLLLSAEDFRNLFSEKIKFSKPYILLYYFEKISPEMQKAIRAYADKNGMDVYSIITNRKWCDRSFAASPGAMMTLYDNASAIITDTFHGTAFSMNFEKPFAVYDEGKKKIEGLLSMYGESDRLFSKPSQIETILNYNATVGSSGNLEKNRAGALELLRKALNN